MSAVLSFGKIVAILEKKLQFSVLSQPANATQIENLKAVWGSDIPENYLSILTVGNGETSSSNDPAILFCGYMFLSVDEVIRESQSIRELTTSIEKDASFNRIFQKALSLIWKNSGIPDIKQNECRSFPENAVKTVHYNNHWIPFASDHCGNYLGIDLTPGPMGTFGQIITFGIDDTDHCVVSPTFSDFLIFTLEAYKHGQFHHELMSNPDTNYQNLSGWLREEFQVGSLSL